LNRCDNLSVVPSKGKVLLEKQLGTDSPQKDAIYGGSPVFQPRGYAHRGTDNIKGYIYIYAEFHKLALRIEINVDNPQVY